MNKEVAKSRILIVEDDATMIRGLKDNFLHMGFDVSTEMDGESALATALSERPDLIVLDIMLPKMNGYDICHAIRQAGFDMPILLLSAKGQEADIVRGLNVGADDYVTKPFSLHILLARVKALLRRHGRQEALIHFGDFEFNVDAKKLQRCGEEVALSPKERGLLSLFIEREGHAITRDYILSIVWQSNVLTTLRSVDRCVTTLRKKIESDPRRPQFIQSIRDIGYRFERS